RSTSPPRPTSSSPARSARWSSTGSSTSRNWGHNTDLGRIRRKSVLCPQLAGPGFGGGLAADEDRVARRDLARPGQRGGEAAALLALLGAGDDQAGDVGEVAQLQQISGDEVAPVVLLDLLDEVVQAAPRALEALVGAHDADVVPHEMPDLVPVLLDDDALVR